MAQHQLPPLKDEKKFEEFICDLFNHIENTNSYQNTEFQPFGVKGQNQKGIDIFSLKTKTVIQCKTKDIRKKDEVIRKSLMDDIEEDLQNVSTLNFVFEKFIFVSTFRDDAILQEHTGKIRKDKELTFGLYYWGWDTLSKYAEQYEEIIKKYFPKFIPKITKPPKKPTVELPESALGKDLLKKNYVTYLIKRYGDWKQIELNKKGEKFNWASLNKHIMNKYRAPGINFIHIGYFNDLIQYLQDKIAKTIFGRNQKAKGKRNYSSFEEHTKGITE